MNNVIIINNQEVIFENKDEQVFCTSLDVAKVFGKRHDHVLRDIENILNDLREIGTSKDLLNFGETYRNTEIRGFGKVKGKTRKDRCYNLTRDGFSLLAMGFTGKKALQFKIAFINAFNEMENIIRSNNQNNTTIDSNIYYKELCDRLLIENKELKSENTNLKRHINGELYLEFLNKLNTFSKIHFKNSKSKALDYIYKTIAIEFMCPTYYDFDISDLESDPRYLRYAIDLCNDAISNNFLSRKLI
ncbi:Cpp32 [Campylobacter jejuni subsp. doylei 269.97]|uniref:Cpp32 n=2 Tax=Campylobacter jejuni subsp. doylei TaxID=32021 RepID=A7H383_CAMJD|nr:Cpp32 [Campylobacter jejuni subsp. doylei 269.97]AVL47218.1 phage regulatory protein [Campylobacter jejuni subsp. doylei]